MNKLIKLADGRPMPALGLGTLFLKDAKAIQHAIVNVGYRHIDTASITMNEKEVGEAIKGAAAAGVHRDEIFVTTKLWHNGYSDPEAALRKSLSALQLEKVDMYVIHWPNNFFVSPKIPMHLLWQRIESLVDLGLTGGIGFSNFNIQLSADVMTYARHMPLYNQLQLNPYNTQTDSLAFMKANEIAVVASSPLGRLGSKVGPKGTSDITKEPIIVEIAAKHGKTPAQIVLAWGLSRGTAVIPKAASPEHQKENFEAQSIELSADEIKSISSLNRGEILFKSSPDVKFNMFQ